MSTEYYYENRHVGTSTLSGTTFIWTEATAEAVASALADPTLAQFTTEYEGADPLRGVDFLAMVAAHKAQDLRNLERAARSAIAASAPAQRRTRKVKR